MKLMMILTVLVAGQEFQPDADYHSEVNDSALLHAKLSNGRPTDVVLGRDEASYARHLDRTFKNGETALEAARNDPGLVVLPYGTEVVVKQEVSRTVRAGRRVIDRRLLSVQLSDSPTYASSLLVLETHVGQPQSEEKTRVLEARYAAYERARHNAELAKREARLNVLRQRQLEELKWQCQAWQSMFGSSGSFQNSYVGPRGGRYFYNGHGNKTYYSSIR